MWYLYAVRLANRRCGVSLMFGGHETAHAHRTDLVLRHYRRRSRRDVDVGC